MIRNEFQSHSHEILFKLDNCLAFSVLTIRHRETGLSFIPSIYISCYFMMCCTFVPLPYALAIYMIEESNKTRCILLEHSFKDDNIAY